MSGFVGFISPRPSESCRPLLQRMLQKISHERSLNSSTVEAPGLNLWAASATDPEAFANGTPFWNENRDVCLIFAGEEFADDHRIEDLKRAGHAVSPGGDYLVHLYEAEGEEFFRKLNGVFAGLIIDHRYRRVILFNDRYGLRRVYFHEGDGGVYFATEAKALLAVLPSTRRLDYKGLGELFTLGCVVEDRTIFQGIQVVPPGSLWVWSAEGTAKRTTYFSREEWESLPALGVEDYYEKLRNTFERILPRYFRNPQRIAMSLTGGLDSRIIMAWANLEPNQVPCYSHCGIVRECADTRIARKVAKVCGQSHRTIKVGGAFFSDFPKLASEAVYLTDGAMDASGAAGLYVNRLARKEIAPIRMTGNYGSEILRRLVAFKPKSPNRMLFTPEFLGHVEKARLVYQAQKRNTHELSFIAFKQVPWHHYSRFALEQSQLTIRSPYLDNEVVALAYQAPPGLVTNQLLGARLIRDGNSALAAFPTDRGPLGRPGLLGRVREQFHEFTFKSEYAYDYGMPQWLARADRLVAPLHLEKLFLGRHKYLHYRYWYRHQLAVHVKDILLDARTLKRPYLDGRYVEKIINAHISGTGNYTSEIHLLLTTELIERELIERS